MSIAAKAMELKAKYGHLLDWKRLLNLNRPQILGLDIGSHSVKIVQLNKCSDGYSVTAAAMAEIDNGSADAGEDKDKKVAAAIRRCYEKTGAATQYMVCGICGPEVAVRPFEFPELLADEIQGAVILEASQVCPFNTDNSNVDWQVAQGTKEGVSGFLVAATGQLLQDKTKLVEDSALICVLMDVDGLALLNCLQMCNGEAGDKPTAVLNVGSRHTTLAISGEKNLPFVRDICYGGEDILGKIADEHNEPVQKVKNALCGTGEAGDAPREFTDSLEQACQKLIPEVNDTLRYYIAQEKSAVVERLLVCGGFALVKGFVPMLDSQLGCTVELWNPFDKIRCHPTAGCNDLIRNNGPALAVATGLAMRSV